LPENPLTQFKLGTPEIVVNVLPNVAGASTVVAIDVLRIFLEATTEPAETVYLSPSIVYKAEFVPAVNRSTPPEPVIVVENVPVAVNEPSRATVEALIGRTVVVPVIVG